LHDLNEAAQERVVRSPLDLPLKRFDRDIRQERVAARKAVLKRTRTVGFARRTASAATSVGFLSRIFCCLFSTGISMVAI